MRRRADAYLLPDGSSGSKGSLLGEEWEWDTLRSEVIIVTLLYCMSSVSLFAPSAFIISEKYRDLVRVFWSVQPVPHRNSEVFIYL